MSHPTLDPTRIPAPDVEPDDIFAPDTLWSNEPPMESDQHRRQMELLINSLEAYWHDRQDFYVSGNLTIYFSPNQRKSEDVRGPDFFVVLGAERRLRRSWTVWAEGGKFPNLIIEILSKETAAVDRGLKRQIYQNTFKTPEYFLFDPRNLALKGLSLRNAAGVYQDIPPTEQGWVWSAELQLYLGVHSGVLRFFTPTGEVVLRSDEQERQRAERERQRAERERQRAEEERQHTEQERQRAEQERQHAEQERQRAEQERQRAEQAEQELARLQAQLRALGIEPTPPAPQES